MPSIAGVDSDDKFIRPPASYSTVSRNKDYPEKFCRSVENYVLPPRPRRNIAMTADSVNTPRTARAFLSTASVPCLDLYRPLRRSPGGLPIAQPTLEPDALRLALTQSVSESLQFGIRSVKLVLLIEELVVHALGERIERAVFLIQLGAESGAVTVGDDELVGEPAGTRSATCSTSAYATERVVGSARKRASPLTLRF